MKIFFNIFIVLISILINQNTLNTAEQTIIFKDIVNLVPISETKQDCYIEVFANVSAYSPTIEECGKDDGITASGEPAVEGRTIAMDNVPFGTKVEINGDIYIVEDRFGGDYRNRVDIYMSSRHNAERFGRQYMLIKIYVQED